MNKIIVNTQAEIDAAPKDFSGVIEIRGGTYFAPIFVRSAVVTAYDSAYVMAWESAHVVACDSAHVWAFDYASATVSYK